MVGPVYSIVQCKKAVGEVLRWLRQKAGITQEEAAARTGIDRSNLSALEAGEQDPSVYYLIRIAASYGLTFTEIAARIEKRALGKAHRKKPWRT